MFRKMIKKQSVEFNFHFQAPILFFELQIAQKIRKTTLEEHKRRIFSGAPNGARKVSKTCILNQNPF